MDGTEAVATVLLLAGSLGMPLLLGMLTWLGRRVLRARSAAEQAALLALANRLTVALWAPAVTLVVAIVVVESSRAAAGLPSLWTPAATAADFGRALVLLPLGAYLLVAQAVVSVVALTWRLPAFAGNRQPSDFGTALVAIAGLAASLLALGTIVLVTLLRLSTEGVP